MPKPQASNVPNATTAASITPSRLWARSRVTGSVDARRAAPALIAPDSSSVIRASRPISPVSTSDSRYWLSKMVYFCGRYVPIPRPNSGCLSNSCCTTV